VYYVLTPHETGVESHPCPPLQDFSFCADEMGNPSLQTMLIQDLVFRMLLRSFQRRHPFFTPSSLSHLKERERTKRQSGVKNSRWVNKSSSSPAAPGISIRGDSGQPHSAAILRSQPTSTIEHAGTHSHYIWESKCHPILLSESLWETMGIDLAVANSRHIYCSVVSYWLSV
jgi:hypothetical protein